MQSGTVHIHGLNHKKPFKSIVGRDENVLYMWSMLHPHAKSLRSSWYYSGLYFKNNIMNSVEIVVLLTNHIITNMTSWTYKRCQDQCHILFLDQLITHYLFYAVKLKTVFCSWIYSTVNIKHFAVFLQSIKLSL